MKFDFPAVNFLSQFNNSNTPNPGTIVDVDILSDFKVLALFSTSLRLFSPDGKELCFMNLEEKSISLGRYADAFVVACLAKTMCVIEVIESELIMTRRIRTGVQYTGACGVTLRHLLCVEEDEPRLHVFNNEMQSLWTRDLKYYTARISSFKSFRKICINSSGYVAISDYANNYVLVFWNGGDDAIVHNVDCPANIAVNQNYVYVVQDKDKNQVLEVCLENNQKRCLLKEEQGIVYPNCISVKMNEKMLIGMDCAEPLLRGYGF